MAKNVMCLGYSYFAQFRVRDVSKKDDMENFEVKFISISLFVSSKSSQDRCIFNLFLDIATLSKSAEFGTGTGKAC